MVSENNTLWWGVQKAECCVYTHLSFYGLTSIIKIHMHFLDTKEINFMLRIFWDILSNLQSSRKKAGMLQIGLKFFSLNWILCSLEVKTIKHRTSWIAGIATSWGYIRKYLSECPPFRKRAKNSAKDSCDKKEM